MSYLDVPRLHFSGHFQADVSTINNEVTFFDNATFQPEDQDLTTDGTKGGWNPEGTGVFRLVGCRITGARLGDRQITTPQDDPVIGMALENGDDLVFGKLVDLDPQQQMVSQIWGMRLRLTDGKQPALFAGEYLPAPFTNLWRRQQTTVFLDQALAAVYQSVLQQVSWQGHASSKVLETLRQASQEGCLSINMNVYGYGRDPEKPRYTLGRVAGTIGPYRGGEPKHFVQGRQMVAVPTSPVAAAGNVYSFQCKVDERRKTLTADFGNSLQIVDAEGGFAEKRKLVMAILKTETDDPLTTVAAGQVELLGTVSYQQPDWYRQTAGVQDFDYSANAWCVANIAQRPLLLLSARPDGSYDVVVQESLGGYYVRADDFVCRLDPGKSCGVDLYATRYGKAFSGAISFGVNMGLISGGNGDPPVGTPPDGVSYPGQLQAGGDGKAVLTITAKADGPGNPRGYIDGQLYGVGYSLTAQPPKTISNVWNFISVLAFDHVDVPEHPTWFGNVQPILQQYSNLYPIMSKHLVELGKYESVVRHLNVLRLAFSQPIEDPNHMPVTRDLSADKRAIILRWMAQRGPDGLPPKGEPVVTVAPARPKRAPAAVALRMEPLQARGKTEVLLKHEAHLKRERSS